MSMLTAQCDELRETAADLREHSTFVGFGGIFNINDEMVDAARQMEDAADTIMGLRDRLTGEGSGTMSYASDALIDAQENTINQLKTENEKLRMAAERDADVMEALVSYIDDSRVDSLCDENAKLRELVRYMHRCYVRGHDWGLFGAPEKAFVEQCMCDLGIEVEP